MYLATYLDSMQVRAILLLLSLLLLLPTSKTFGAQVTVAWDPVTASGLAGYNVYYGTASGNYSLKVNAGNQTSATISGLAEGATYYFVATDYNTAGVESGFSNEVKFTVASSCSYTISPTSASVGAGGGTGQVTVTTGSTCSWTTSNPVSWVTITSGASGTGSGIVSYSFQTNTGTTSRTAGLTIAGITFTVTQAGTGGATQAASTCTTAPSAATLRSPSGAVTTNTPTYTWNAVPCSSWYYLWVDDSAGTRIQQWYTAADAGCASGTGTCSVTPGTILNNGSGQWWIQTWDSVDYGPWSTGMGFWVRP
jgi:hypothetical protein